MRPLYSTGRGERFGFAILTALMLSVCAAPASAQTLERIKQTGKLTLGYGTETRPFSYRDDGGKPAGFSIELCKKIADSAKTELGLSSLAVTYVPLAREDALRAVRLGKVDLLCDPFLISIQARKEVSFSIPIFASGIVAVVRSSAPTRLTNLLTGTAARAQPTWRANADQVLQRTTFSAVAGSRVEKLMTERMQELSLAPKVAPAKDYAQGLDNVASGRADVFFGDRALLLDAVKREYPKDLQVLDKYFTYEVAALALSRNDEDFRLFVDAVLSKTYRSDDFKDLYAKWFGPPNHNARIFFQKYSLPD